MAQPKYLSQDNNNRVLLILLDCMNTINQIIQSACLISVFEIISPAIQTKTKCTLPNGKKEFRGKNRNREKIKSLPGYPNPLCLYPSCQKIPALHSWHTPGFAVLCGYSSLWRTELGPLCNLPCLSYKHSLFL